MIRIHLIAAALVGPIAYMLLRSPTPVTFVERSQPTGEPPACTACPTPAGLQSSCDSSFETFAGSVLSVTLPAASGADYIVRFHAGEFFKKSWGGDVRDIVVSASDWECGLHFAVGERWIVFAKLLRTAGQPDRAVTFRCSRTKPFDETVAERIRNDLCEPVQFTASAAPGEVTVGDEVTFTLLAQGASYFETTLEATPTGLVSQTNPSKCDDIYDCRLVRFKAIAPGIVTFTLSSRVQLHFCICGSRGFGPFSYWTAYPEPTIVIHDSPQDAWRHGRRLALPSIRKE